jgi:hypothetical protein
MSGLGPTRRHLLTVPLAVGLAVESGCSSPQPPASSPTAARTIDVHCHLFNARDIPVEPFIREVVLREYPLADVIAEPVILLAQGILELGAMSANHEAQLLRQQASGLTTFAAVELPDIRDEDGLIQDRVRRAVTQMEAPNLQQLQEFGPTPQARMTPALDRFLRDLIKRTGADAQIAPPRSGELSPEAVLGVSPDAAAVAIASIGGEIRGIILLASLLTLPRASLAERLRALPRRGGNEIVFFAPAMVDYGYWLNAERVTTPLAEQVDVMSAIASRKGSPFAVHAYVSFCPWRQMMEPGQLDTVKDAILNMGCIGVKVYPVMGFLPYGNADASDKGDYPRRLRDTGKDWATRLDHALGQLYDFCVAEDVPILTHCSQSQDTSDAAGRRAPPAAWGEVVREGRWPTLRVSLGHFGGFWGLTKPGLDGWTAGRLDG